MNSVGLESRKTSLVFNRSRAPPQARGLVSVFTLESGRATHHTGSGSRARGAPLILCRGRAGPRQSRRRISSACGGERQMVSDTYAIGWWIESADDDVYGPVSRATLLRFLEGGVISPNTLVRHCTEPSSRPVADVPG